MSLWSRLAHRLLDHPYPFLAVLVVLTGVLGFAMTGLQIDHKAGNFAASDSEAMQAFQRVGAVFGKSETVLYLVFDGADPYDPAFLSQLDALGRRIAGYEGVETVLSLANVPFLVRDGNRLAPRPLFDPALAADSLRARIEGQPFLRGLLLSADGTTTLAMVRIAPAFNDSPARLDLVERIAAEAQALPGRVALAGFPYLRTQYARRVTAEAPRFTVMALLISLLFLFLTFRAWRAVLLPTVIVLLGIVWTFGLIALFDHRINIVTAVLPALLVIIGMANAIHLTTKFYDLYDQYQSRRKAIEQTIRTVGVATLLTALTTAIGFGVLVISGSRLLAAFGLFAGAGIMVLYALSMILIPYAYLRLRPPSQETAALATHDAFAAFFEQKATLTQRHSGLIVAAAALLFAVGLFGAARISSDIYVFSDFYPDDPLRQDLAVFETHFGGVLPMEVVLTAETPGRFRSLAALRHLESLQHTAAAYPHVGTTLSAVTLVKLANQAYFGGHPATYRLPAGYELPFLQNALKGLLGGSGEHGLGRNLPVFMDSTFTTARLFMGVEDIGTTAMNDLADSVRAQAQRLFPAAQYDVVVTGTAVTSTRSGESLVRNLLVSLAVALLVISGLMALLFRSARLTLISLIPNVIPLLLVGGAMGFAGVALKPSTALIFSLAFGIAVDDTIHFLSKYRFLRGAGRSRDAAVRQTLRETGKAILFTSLVLMAGFLVFTGSSFGGTVNMGALTALTLGAALLANLVLLPALLYRYAPG